MTRVLITDSVVAEDLIRQRRARGVDTFDEMWEGVYHVVPAGSRRHGEAQASILAVLREWTWPRVATVIVVGPVNIGTSDSYRVPDAAVIADILSDDDVFIPTALMVIEVLSPGDDTFKKFDFYLERGVREILIVDPQTRTVELHAFDGVSYAVVDDSTVLGMTNAAPQLARAMGWPANTDALGPITYEPDGTIRDGHHRAAALQTRRDPSSAPTERTDQP